MAHLYRGKGFPRMPKLVGSLGDFGVRVFFVISGYLITTLLLDERARSGTISLRGFYVRRIYRIFPAFYAFLAVVVTLAATGAITLQPGDILHAATFTMNHHQARSWWVGHLWSLSVEEQFYLIWPTVFLVAGIERALGVAAAAVVLAPAARVLTWHLMPSAREGIGESFPTICDSVALGCLLAGMGPWLGRQPRYLWFLRSPLAALLPLVALGAHQLWISPSVYLPVGHSAVDVALALYIDRVVRFPGTLDGRVLNVGALEFVGKLSYSLYLWQQLFLNRTSTSPLCAFPLNLVLAALVAVVSYYGVERTFLRLRARRSMAGGQGSSHPPR